MRMRSHRILQENDTNSQILTNSTKFENDQDTKLCDDCEVDYKEEDEARDYYSQVNGILYYIIALFCIVYFWTST